LESSKGLFRAAFAPEVGPPHNATELTYLEAGSRSVFLRRRLRVKSWPQGRWGIFVPTLTYSRTTAALLSCRP